MRLSRFGIGAVRLALLVTTATTSGAFAENCSNKLASGLIALDVNEHTVLGYVPKGVVGKASPLVVNLHPTGGKGLYSLKEGMPAAHDNGFVMIAPEGVIGPIFGGWTWNVPGVPTYGGGYPSEDARDDVDFISKAIDKAIKEACIDTRRIYVIGFSGGGRMASRLACDLSDRIASVVAIGGIRFSKASDTKLGLPHAVDCVPSRAVPIKAIHGHWDPVNPWYDVALGDTPLKNPEDGNKTIVAEAPKAGTSWSYSGETALARWVEHNGCDLQPVTHTLAKDIEQRDYVNCRDDVEVSLVFYRNLGHAVPGYEMPWAPGQADSPINGYELAWDLLKDDSLPK